MLMGLCIWFYLLLDKLSVRTVGLGTNLSVQQNAVRHHYIDSFTPLVMFGSICIGCWVTGFTLLACVVL